VIVVCTGGMLSSLGIVKSIEEIFELVSLIFMMLINFHNLLKSINIVVKKDYPANLIKKISIHNKYLKNPLNTIQKFKDTSNCEIICTF